MKTTVLIILLFGCGFNTYSQKFQFSIDDLSAAAQSERQRFVFQFADSCLHFAKQQEAHGKQYEPRDYFSANSSINALAKKYNVSPPIGVLTDLRTIMLQGRKIPTDELREKIIAAHPNRNTQFSVVEFFQDLVIAFSVVLGLFLFVWIIAQRESIWEEVKKFIASFQIIRQELGLIVVLIIIESRFYYLVRPPNDFNKKIFHVPALVR